MNRRYLILFKFVFIANMLFCSQLSHAQILTLDITKQEISCTGEEDGRAIVTVEGGQGPYSYVWSNGEEQQVISSLKPGTYEVTVTDFNGVTETSAVGLLEVEPIVVELKTMDGFCGDRGEIEAIVSGGVGPFQYLWSTEEFSRKIEDLEQGTYSLTVTDRGQCDEVLSASVVVNGDGLILSTDFEVPTCSGKNDGFISVSQIGGEMPIEYTWSNGTTGTSIDNLIAGTYTVFGVDAFGCTDGIVVILQDPDDFTVELVNQNDALYAKVEGGTPSYKYTWSNGATETTVINNLAPGDYSLTVEDSKGCTTSGNGEVLGPLSQKTIEGVLGYSISPTLVESEMNLSLDLSKAESVLFEIFSLDGTRMYFSELHGQNIRSAIELPNGLLHGFYIIKISANSKWTIIEKFIKK